MTRKTRKPAQTPPPEPKEPRGERPDQADAPAVSLYDSSLSASAKDKIADARKVEGLDEEIALLRQRLDKLLATQPNNDSLIFKAIDLLIRAVAAKSRTSGDSSAPTEQGIENMLRDASDKFGLKIIPWDSNC